LEDLSFEGFFNYSKYPALKRPPIFKMGM